MRLIDADKLIDEMVKVPGNRWNTKTFGETLGRIPTIDAIPVEWLKDKKGVLSFDHGVLVNWLIREWQMEQEAQDG